MLAKAKRVAGDVSANNRIVGGNYGAEKGSGWCEARLNRTGEELRMVRAGAAVNVHADLLGGEMWDSCYDDRGKSTHGCRAPFCGVKG